MFAVVDVGPGRRRGHEARDAARGDEHAQVLVARARRQVDERLANLEQQMQAQRSKLAAQTTAATGELERVATRKCRPPIVHERFGTRLPAGSLFR